MIHHVNYVITDCTEEDFSNVFETDWNPENADHREYIAAEIGESYYNDDPEDPYDFNCKVQIKINDTIYTYNINASLTINFYAQRVL